MLAEGNMKKYTLLLLLPILITTLFAKEVIAVLNLEQRGLSNQEAEILTQRLTTKLISIDKYQVVERNNMDKILKEQKFQHSGCTDSECAVEIGQLLNTDFIVVGSVSKFGSTWAIDARLIDVALGKSLISAEFSMEGKIDVLLTIGMASIAKQLCNFSTDKKAVTIIVSGKVIDHKTLEPITKVNIFTAKNGTNSNSLGEFNLELIDEMEKVTFSHIGYSEITLTAYEIGRIVNLSPIFLPSEDVLVRSGLREVSILDATSSVTIISSFNLANEPLQHFQGLTQSVPNLNWAGGTSRPRYFQIRGVGERSLYTGEGPPNFSVGFVIDDIDFSGIGMPASLFDIQQVEILRGPQSSIYGANAMAGLINMRSTEPNSKFGGSINTSIGTDKVRQFGISLNKPISKNLGTRFSIFSNKEDGFRNNQYKNSTNSNGKNELFVKNKTRWTPSSQLKFDLSAMYSKQNNKYDVWAADNNEELKTYSDKEGMDSQNTSAFSLRTNISNVAGMEVLSITTYSQNEMEHSYDGDWGNRDYWKDEPFNFDPDVEGWAYDFFDKTNRDRKSFSQEFRLHKSLFSGSQLTIGIYLKSTNEKDDASGYLMGGNASKFNGSFDMTNTAGYFQYEQELNPQLSIQMNSRYENSLIEYIGTSNNYGADSKTIDVQNKDALVGFKAAVKYNLSQTAMVYTSISRGYKAGGINQNPYLGTSNRSYEPEFNLNYEAGYKSVSGVNRLQLTIFYMDRLNQQVNISSQQEEGNPNSFYFYTANAATGNNYGVEFDYSTKLYDKLTARFDLGYLSTNVDPYEFKTDSETSKTLGNRELAHAPKYTFSVQLNYSLPFNLTAGIAISGKDKFYYSDSHNQQSEAYQLLDLNLNYNKDSWSISAWGKNILDTRYGIRGFYFGLEPPNYADKLYIHWGDPAQYGISLKYNF